MIETLAVRTYALWSMPWIIFGTTLSLAFRGKARVVFLCLFWPIILLIVCVLGFFQSNWNIPAGFFLTGILFWIPASFALSDRHSK